MSEELTKNLLESVTTLGQEQDWHHNIELPGGTWTCPEKSQTLATNIKKWERLKPILQELNVQGMRVLDVGCSEGYYSFQMSKMGAREIIAIDLNDLRLRKSDKSLLGNLILYYV